MIQHGRSWPVYSEDAIAEVADLLRAGRSFDYGAGPETSDLESQFSRRYGDARALSFNSGTSALLAAYVGLGIGASDEVVVPSLTFLATASPLLLLGAVPVLADSGEPNGNVTAETIRARITPGTKAVAITHLFGHPCDVAPIQALCNDYGLPLVEDCSHAHGSTIDGQPVGTFGDVAVFSTGAMKIVSGGMGGVLLTDDDLLFDRACLLGHFVQRSRASIRSPEHRRLADVGLGGNLRMSPPAAALASSHMRSLEDLCDWKARNAEQLLVAFDGAPGIDPLPRASNVTMGGWHDIVIAVAPDNDTWSRDDLLSAFAKRGMKVRTPSTHPLHTASVFTGLLPSSWLRYSDEVRRSALDLAAGSCPHAMSLHSRWISLPAEYFYDEEGTMVKPYVDAIRDTLA